MTPTKPGWYWWTPAGRGRPIPMIPGRVGTNGDDGLALHSFAFDGHKWNAVAYPLNYAEFGPRIPDPPQLEAMRELAAQEPLSATAADYGAVECVICPGTWDDDLQGVLHAPDCPWLLAQPPKEDAP